MLKAFSERVIIDLKRVGDWPQLAQVIDSMRKIRAEMETEAHANTAAAEAAAIAAEVAAGLAEEDDDDLTALDQASKPDPARHSFQIGGQTSTATAELTQAEIDALNGIFPTVQPTSQLRMLPTSEMRSLGTVEIVSLSTTEIGAV